MNKKTHKAVAGELQVLVAVSWRLLAVWVHTDCMRAEGHTQLCQLGHTVVGNL